MTEAELKAIEAEIAEHTGEHEPVCSCNRYRALVAEVRRLQSQVADLKARAATVRAFWRRHPGDHVVSQGISEAGRALLEHIEALP